MFIISLHAMAVLSDNKGNKVGNLFLQIVSERERDNNDGQLS